MTWHVGCSYSIVLTQMINSYAAASGHHFDHRTVALYTHNVVWSYISHAQLHVGTHTAQQAPLAGTTSGAGSMRPCRQQIPVSQELWPASQIPDPDAACSLFSGHHSCSSQGSNPSVPVCTSMAMGSRYGMGACYTFSTLIKFVENAYNIYIFK